MHENYQDVLNQLRDFGLLIDSVESDRAKPKRTPVNLDLCPVDNGKQRTAGWYQLNTISIDNKSYLVGSYGYWKGADNNAQKIQWDKKVTLTPEQRKAMADQHKAAKKHAEFLRGQEIDKASIRAQKAWRNYIPDGSCDYLDKKQVKAHGVRFHKTEDTMVIPMQDAKGKIFGLQIIRGSQSMAKHADLMKHNPKLPQKPQKQYWPAGLDKVGHYHLIGSPREIVLIAEGYATAASIHEATGLPIAVAYDANNITPVAKALKKSYPQATVIICADDDYLQKCKHLDCQKLTTVTTPECDHCGKPHGKKNAGVEQAQNAALSVGGLWIAPNFINEQGQDVRTGKKLTDFNDLANHSEGGQHLVRAQIEAMTQDVKIKKPATKSLPTQQGDGERLKARATLEVEDLVERFRFVDDDTGDYVFDTWTHKMVKRNKMVQMLKKGVRFDDVKSDPVWESNAIYLDEIGFDPTGKDTNIKCNMYTGWPTRPANIADPISGCSKILDLLKFMCDNELNSTEVFNWVLNWMAYPIQHPGAKMQTALVFHGLQGTGKSLLFETYARIYGDYGIIINQGAMEDNFNSDWVSRKLFVVADEVVARSDMYHMKNQLKGMITGEWIRVNPKNVAATKERNHMNLVFLSNEHNPVVLEGDDRRHFVVWTPKKLPEKFYYEVVEQIENGGLEAFHQMLLQIDLGDFKHYSKPPMTHAKQSLIDINADTPEAFMKEWISGDLGLPFGPAPKTKLYSAYKKWCQIQGERFPRNARQFMPYLKKFGVAEKTAGIYDNVNYTGHTKSTKIAEPTEQLLGELLKDPQQQQDHIQHMQTGHQLSHWRTDAVLAFSNAFEGSIYV